MQSFINEKYFNDDQLDHMKFLSENPDKKCGCGWYTKEECITYCSHPKCMTSDCKEKVDLRNQGKWLGLNSAIDI